MQYEFTKEEIEIILKGLVELPAKYSYNVIAKIIEINNKKDEK
jgi:hypothetical protein